MPGEKNSAGLVDHIIRVIARRVRNHKRIKRIREERAGRVLRRHDITIMDIADEAVLAILRVDEGRIARFNGIPVLGVNLHHAIVEIDFRTIFDHQSVIFSG